MWSESVVLVIGGTGSFGKKFIKTVLRDKAPKKLIVFSRDELKQHEMRTSGYDDPRLRYFIGDVRDVDRLRRAMSGVDIVVHAAALKQVPACEYNPFEAVLTNVMGARNVIDASIDTGVKKVLFISTDKAVSPVNLYGATKLVGEKLMIQANAYAGGGNPRFSCVRYGNVVGSRGSVIPLFLEQRKTGTITITDERMTRFWITLEQGVSFVTSCIERMQGGELFVPKLRAMNIMDLAHAIAPECKVKSIGIRPGEKLHEALMSDEEAVRAVDAGDMFVVLPSHPWWHNDAWSAGSSLPEGFTYVSNHPDGWLSTRELQEMAAAADIEQE